MSWHRTTLWAAHDQRHARRMRDRSFLLAAALAAAWIGVAMMSYACHEMYLVDEGLRSPVRSAEADAECVTDDDCVLVPSVITCCGECEPVPPFDAVTRAELANLRQDIADDCAPPTWPCDPPACAPLPEGCEARAICGGGECRVQASSACVFR